MLKGGVVCSQNEGFRSSKKLNIGGNIEKQSSHPCRRSDKILLEASREDYLSRCGVVLTSTVLS